MSKPKTDDNRLPGEGEGVGRFFSYMLKKQHFSHHGNQLQFHESYTRHVRALRSPHTHTRKFHMHKCCKFGIYVPFVFWRWNSPLCSFKYTLHTHTSVLFSSVVPSMVRDLTVIKAKMKTKWVSEAVSSTIWIRLYFKKWQVIYNAHISVSVKCICASMFIYFVQRWCWHNENAGDKDAFNPHKTHKYYLSYQKLCIIKSKWVFKIATIWANMCIGAFGA